MITLRKFPALEGSSGDSIPPLVLIHAFPLSSAMWVEAIRALQGLLPSLEVVCVDVPGFGGSAVQEGWSLAGAARDIVESWKGKQPVIGGLSMGGYIACALHRENPSFASAYIFSNTKAAADSAEGKLGRESFALEVLQRGSIVAVEKQLDKLVGATTLASRPEVREQVREWILSAKPEGIAAGLRAMAKRDDSSDMLATITKPTLVIASSEDGIIPTAEMRTMSEAMLNARFEEMTGVGHLSAVEAPDAWAAIVAKFLQQL